MRLCPTNSLWRDPRTLFCDLPMSLLVFLMACVRAPVVSTGDRVIPRTELWVDAFSTAGGDGTREHPLKAIPSPVLKGATVRVSSGLYAGPFVLEEGSRIEGTGEVVLTGEAGQTVVTAAKASLEHVSIQGGAVGLEAGPLVLMRAVNFSGQRERAVVVQGELSLSGTQLQASVEGIDGLVVKAGAKLVLRDAKFAGGFRRAVSTEGGSVELMNVSAEGAKNLLHAVNADSRLQSVRSAAGSGPALLVAGGRLQLDEGDFQGHEYSMQLTRGALARISGLRARNGAQGCVSALMSEVWLTDAKLTNCGPGGALSLLDCQSVVSQLDVSTARELAVFVRKGRAEFHRVNVSKVIAAPDALGDAFLVRDASVRADTVHVSDVEGSGLFASAHAEVNIDQLEVERAQQAALFVERAAQVNIGSLLVRGGMGPAVLVPDAATVTMGTLSVSGGDEMPVYAECKSGAKVSYTRLESTIAQLESRCISKTK